MITLEKKCKRIQRDKVICLPGILLVLVKNETNYIVLDIDRM